MLPVMVRSVPRTEKVDGPPLRVAMLRSLSTTGENGWSADFFENIGCALQE